MKGLIYSEPMVKAWMAGLKDLTRRLIKLPDGFMPVYAVSAGLEDPSVWFDFVDADGNLKRIKSSYRPGETVYIKETWGIVTGIEGPEDGVIYKEDGEVVLANGDKMKWKSPRFMPEWASRSHALIVSVKPERIQSITIDEAKREGFDCSWLIYHEGDNSHNKRRDIIYEKYGEQCANTHIADELSEFRYIWETLHPGSWDKNEWVWRIELRKV